MVSDSPGRGLETSSVPAYFATNAATAPASRPVTMFCGMIEPEKPPFRIANRACARLSVRWSRFGPSTRTFRASEPWVPAGVIVWQPPQRWEKSTAPA